MFYNNSISWFHIIANHTPSELSSLLDYAKLKIYINDYQSCQCYHLELTCS